MTIFEPADHPRADAGQFTDKAQSEPEAALAPYQRTRAPLPQLRTQTIGSPLSQYVDYRDEWELNPPYQRGSVWTEEQRRDLIRSVLLELPIGTIVVNDRGYEQKIGTVVIDGKQRIEALRAFVDDEFTVPRDWFDDRDLTEVDHDRDEVLYSDLNGRAHRGFRNRSIPHLKAKVGTVKGEAMIFRLLNGGGTAQTSTTMAAAAEVENS